MSLLYIRPTHRNSRRVAATLLTLLLAGCSHSAPETESKSISDTESTPKSGDGKSGSGGSSSAIDDLVDKLQPKIDPNFKPPTKPAPVKPKTIEPSPVAPVKAAPTKPGDQPSDEVLTAGFEKMIGELVAALSSGSLEAAKATVLAENDFKKVLTPGAFTVLGAQLPAQNRRLLQTVVDVAGGKKVEHTYTAGRLNSSGTKGASFRLGMPMISGAKLQLDIEDIPVPMVIAIDQCIWFEGRWKIFNMKI